MSEETTSGMGSRLLYNAALKNGVSSQKIKSLTGICTEALEDPDLRIPVRTVRRLADLAFEASGDPALGLYLTLKYRETPHQLLMHLALNSDNLLEATNLWSRYVKLDADVYRIEVRDEGKNNVIRFVNHSEYQAIWLQEYHLSQVLVNCRMFLDEKIDLVEARFIHASPSYLADYEAVFQAPIIFNAGENALVFTKENMLRPLPTANRLLKELLIRQAKSMYHKVTVNETYTEKTREYVIKHLADGNANVKSLSQTLNMDRTTLQRKLRKEGTCFSKILDDARQFLAVNYLKEGYRIKDISYLLGYSEPSAFQHTFRKWFKKSPGLFKSNASNSSQEISE